MSDIQKPSSFKVKHFPASIVVATRPSKLALIQTQIAIDAVTKSLSNENLENGTKGLFTGKSFQKLIVESLGDKKPTEPLSALENIRSASVRPGGVFTKEVEDRLLDGSAQIAVHSLKDLPSYVIFLEDDPFAYPTILKRADPRDVIVLRNDLMKTLTDPKTEDLEKSTETFFHTNKPRRSLEALPAGSIIGTSALRRHAFICRNYPNLKIEGIRGNVDTRLQKLENINKKCETKYDALILAAAGLERLQLYETIFCYLDPLMHPYSPGQGALICQCLKTNTNLISFLQKADHLPTRLEVLAERQFLYRIEGGCTLPIGVACQCRAFKSNQLPSVGGSTADVPTTGIFYTSQHSYPIGLDELPNLEDVSSPDSTTSNSILLGGGEQRRDTIRISMHSDDSCFNVLELYLCGQIWSPNGEETCKVLQFSSCLLSKVLFEKLSVQGIREDFDFLGLNNVTFPSTYTGFNCIMRCQSEDDLCNFAKNVGDFVASKILNSEQGCQILTKLQSISHCLD